MYFYLGVTKPLWIFFWTQKNTSPSSQSTGFPSMPQRLLLMTYMPRAWTVKPSCLLLIPWESTLVQEISNGRTHERTDPEKTWVSNNSLATYWTGSVGIRSYLMFGGLGLNFETNKHVENRNNTCPRKNKPTNLKRNKVLWIFKNENRILKKVASNSERWYGNDNNRLHQF